MDTLQEDLDKRLTRTTQYLWHEHILRVLPPACLQANITPLQASKLWLKWSLYDKKFAELEAEHRIGHSTYGDMFNSITYHTNGFASRWVTPFTHEIRRRVARKYLPPILATRGFTGHLDSSHFSCWCWRSRGEDEKCLISHKTKKSALTTQVLMLPNLLIGWVSYTDGAATHDKTHTQNTSLNQEPWLNPRDLFTSDCAYHNCPQIVPPLSNDQILANPELHQYATQFYEFHRKIEKSFGDIKKRFEVFRKYRYQKQFFNRHLRACCGLENIERRILLGDMQEMRSFEPILTYDGSLIDPFAPEPVEYPWERGRELMGM